jgi:hypothetical protein
MSPSNVGNSGLHVKFSQHYTLVAACRETDILGFCFIATIFLDTTQLTL